MMFKKILMSAFLFLFLHGIEANRSMEEWIQYDQDHQCYIPFLNPSFDGVHLIHKRINVNKFKDYQLKVKADAGLSVFFNNNLLFELSEKGSQQKTISIKSLINTHKNILSEEEAVLTFYNHEKDLQSLEASIIYATDQKEQLEQATSDEIKAVIRQQANTKNVFISIFLLIVLLLAMYKHLFTDHFVQFFNISFSPIGSADSQQTNHLSLGDTVAIFMIGMFVWFSFCVITFGNNSAWNIFSPWTYTTWYGIIGGALVLSLVLIIKYYFSVFIAWIFSLGGISKAYFNSSIKVMFLASAMLLFFSLIRLTSIEDQVFFISSRLIQWIIVLGLLLAALRGLFSITEVIKFRNIYFFSYICLSEITPIMIISSLVLKV